MSNAIFANTPGWSISIDSRGGNTIQELSYNRLADPSTAATYLKTTYSSCVWAKTETTNDDFV